MSTKKRVEPYELDPKFEMAVVVRECGSARFHAMVGWALEPEAFPSEPAKLAITMAHLVAAEQGDGAGNQAIVLQRLRRQYDEGKYTKEQVLAVYDYLDAADAMHPPSSDEVAREMAPLLKRRLEQHQLMGLMDDFGNRRDIYKRVEELRRISRLGEDPFTLGALFGDGTRSLVEKIRNLARLPTGIPDVDQSIGGGLGRSCFGFLVGGTGEGKSLGLTTFLGKAQRMGLCCLLDSLELSGAIQSARLLANNTGIPTDDVMGSRCDEAHERAAQMNLGPLLIAEGIRTLAGVRDWVKRAEDKFGRKVDAVFIDYADKMRSENTRLDRKDMMLEVYDGLLQLAQAQDGWVWSASQAKVKERKDKKRLKDAEDAADSADKGRSADLVLTLNQQGDGTLLWKVAKNRIGASGQVVGPLATDFACGSIAAVDREVLPF